MTSYLITRHSGAIDWAKQQNLKIDKVLSHINEINIERLSSNDKIYGNLPLHIINTLCEKNIEYWNLDLDIPLALRGKDLNLKEMNNCHARIERYTVKKSTE